MISVSIDGIKKKRAQLLVIVTDDEKMDYKIFNDVNEFYLIVLTSASDEKIAQIFKSIWEQKNLLNVNLLYEKGSKINLITFYPFSQNECNNTKTLKVINEFEDGKWKSKELFYPPKISNFHSCKLRLGITPAFPGTTRIKHKNGTIDYKGSDIEIVNELSKRLNFKNDILHENTWGDVFPNNTGFGLLGEIQRQRVDYVCGFFFLSTAKARNFDHTQPYFYVPFVVIVPPGAPYTSMEYLILTFTIALWSSFIGTTVLILLLIFGSEKLPKKIKKFFYDKNEKFKYDFIIIIIFGESSQRFPKKNAARILIMAFAIFCLVMRTAYTSQMFNNLQSGAAHREMHSLEEMLENDFTLFLPKYFDGYADVKEIKYDQKKIQILKINEEEAYFNAMNNPNIKGGLAEPFDNILRMNNATFYGHTIPDPLTKTSVVIYLQKKSYLTNEFSQKILEMQAAGLIEYWINLEGSIKTNSIIKDDTPKVLTLKQLSAPFIISAAGLIISSIAFIVEVISYRYKRSSKKSTFIQKIPFRH